MYMHMHVYVHVYMYACFVMIGDRSSTEKTNFVLSQSHSRLSSSN